MNNFSCILTRFSLSFNRLHKYDPINYMYFVHINTIFKLVCNSRKKLSQTRQFMV
ncbi:hypothetical protein KL86CLO1_12021 [uncultured Eubacteriales bacterium]|uniref:Uncharacterized protein n=1 Tax=uncultured Eubacteriales bacterium TaxID=172733 RepID=A0A212K154_9FIRM|nr:hypothetical protein KL86CLO1_12021 [uncultured Eubacteriales bacterium]